MFANTDIQIKFQMNGRQSAVAAECTVIEAQTNFLVFKADNSLAFSVPYGCIETLKINGEEVKDISQVGITKILMDEEDSGSSSSSGSEEVTAEPETPTSTEEPTSNG